MNINQINAAIKAEVGRAKSITELASAGDRGLTEAEDTALKVHLAKIDDLKADLNLAKRAGEKADVIRGRVGEADGFKALAEQIKATGRGELRLKDVSQSDTDLLSTRIEPGITGLPADERYLAPVFNSQDSGTALHIQDFLVTARGIGSGDDVERDPTAVTEKAEASVEITGVNSDLRMLAVMVRDVPNALLAAEGQLASVLEGEMRLQIRKALDEHCIAQIDAAGVAHGGTGSTVQELVRSGQNEMALNGFKPDVVAVSPGDAASVDLLKVVDEVSAYPFGLRVVVTPDVEDGAPILVDTSKAGVLYTGALSVQSDPYSGFSTNETSFRAEGLCLLHIRRPDAILVADGSGS